MRNRHAFTEPHVVDTDVAYYEALTNLRNAELYLEVAKAAEAKARQALLHPDQAKR
jgi:hypothetical protein